MLLLLGRFYFFQFPGVWIISVWFETGCRLSDFVQLLVEDRDWIGVLGVFSIHFHWNLFEANTATLFILLGFALHIWWLDWVTTFGCWVLVELVNTGAPGRVKFLLCHFKFHKFLMACLLCRVCFRGGFILQIGLWDCLWRVVSDTGLLQLLQICCLQSPIEQSFLLSVQVRLMSSYKIIFANYERSTPSLRSWLTWCVSLPRCGICDFFNSQELLFLIFTARLLQNQLLVPFLCAIWCWQWLNLRWLLTIVKV